MREFVGYELEVPDEQVRILVRMRKTLEGLGFGGDRERLITSSTRDQVPAPIVIEGPDGPVGETPSEVSQHPPAQPDAAPLESGASEVEPPANEKESRPGRLPAQQLLELSTEMEVWKESCPAPADELAPLNPPAFVTTICTSDTWSMLSYMLVLCCCEPTSGK